jgi:hypothetical protein
LPAASSGPEFPSGFNGCVRTADSAAKLPRTTVIHPAFKLIFIAVVAITVFAGIGEILMALSWAIPTPNQQTAFQAADFAWKAGIGAIFGLLGGKQA